MKELLKKKGIEISVKRYAIDALSAMAMGLFATLLIGLILKTAGEQLSLLSGENAVTAALVSIGTTAMGLMGAGIGIAVSYSLKAPLMVVVCGAINGMAGAALGGPAGSFIAALFGCEFGKLVYKSTKLDIIVTPAVSLIAGYIISVTAGPVIDALMKGLGAVIMAATELRPFEMGIIVSVIMGLVLTAPISSAALAIMLDLSGLAAGAATAGCCAQMIGFAVISYKANGMGGLAAQGLGTSMLQVPNIIKNPWILLPPTLAAAVTGPVSTLLMGMTNVPSGAGMGTCGLVGQISTFTSMGFTGAVLLKVLILHFALPAALSWAFYVPLVSWKKIKHEDLALDL